jgi:hypothetical protein
MIMNTEKFYIIDDFYDDPDHVRDIALKSSYDIPPDNNKNWVGLTTKNCHVVTNLDAKVSKHMKFVVRTKFSARNGFLEGLLRGKPRNLSYILIHPRHVAIRFTIQEYCI